MKISKTALIALTITATFFSGCSLKNPFGIGYDTSVSETSKSKTFGVSGSPKDIYKHRDIIRKTQDEYLSSGIKDVLYFGIDKKGNMLVKKDRDEEWSKYETSYWKEKIDKANEKNKKNEEALERKRDEKNKGAKARGISSSSDILVTAGNDLSIQYKEQGRLISTRTQVGDIIRDNGQIQQVFVANYIDNEGNLVSSHELYVVVKDPSWIVGEKTPKTTNNMGEIPTPVSKGLLKEQARSEKADERIVDSYLRDDPAAVTNAINDAPTIEDEQDSKIIRNFIQSPTR
jgi:lipoprotein